MKNLSRHFILSFQSSLSEFYHLNSSPKPWKIDRDPYKIWLFEVVMQQTRMAQGLPYFERLIEKYPTIYHLAESEEDQLFSVWKGLGYYSRARNLHYTAQYIVNELKGNFPENFSLLIQLKGVGDYTAAAIASFAFREDVAVLDGNVHRILSRIFGINRRIQASSDKRLFQSLAMKLLPLGESDTFNQAMMDLGSKICTPVSPKCDSCTMSDICYAYNHNKISVLPPPKIRPLLKDRYFYCLFVECKGKIYLEKRTSNDIWKGLYQGIMYEGSEYDLKFWKEKGVDVSKVEWSDWKTQALSHQRVWMKIGVLKGKNIKAISTFESFKMDRMEHIPFPRVLSRFWENKNKSLQ